MQSPPKKEKPDETVRDFALSKPIEFAGQTYTSIRLEEPTVEQLENASEPGLRENPVRSNITLVADVAGVPQEVIRKIKKRDFERMVGFLQGFTDDAPKTGGAP